MDNELMARRLRPPSEPAREAPYAHDTNEAPAFEPADQLRPEWPVVDRPEVDDGVADETSSSDATNEFVAVHQATELADVPWEFDSAGGDAAWAEPVDETLPEAEAEAEAGALPEAEAQAPWAETATEDTPWAETASVEAPWADTATDDAPWTETASVEAPWAETATEDAPWTETASVEAPWADTATDEAPWAEATSEDTALAAEDAATWDRPADDSPQPDTFAPDLTNWDEPENEGWPRPSFAAADDVAVEVADDMAVEVAGDVAVEAADDVAVTADPDDAYAPVLADIADPVDTLWQSLNGHRTDDWDAPESPETAEPPAALAVEPEQYDPTADFAFAAMDDAESDVDAPATDHVAEAQAPADTAAGPTPPAELFEAAVDVTSPAQEPATASMPEAAAGDFESLPPAQAVEPAAPPALVPMVVAASASPSPDNPANVILRIELTFVADPALVAQAQEVSLVVQLPGAESVGDAATDPAPQAVAEQMMAATQPEADVEAAGWAEPAEMMSAVADDWTSPQADDQAVAWDHVVADDSDAAPATDMSESSPQPPRGDPLSRLPAALIERRARPVAAPVLAAAMSVGPAAAPAIKGPGLWFLTPKPATATAAAGAAAEQAAPTPSSPMLTAALTFGMFVLVVVLVLVFLLTATSLFR